MNSLTREGTAPNLLQALLDKNFLELPDHLLDLLPIGVYVCDRHAAIVRCNRTAAELWGRTPAHDDLFCGSSRLYHLDGTPMVHADSPMAEVLAAGIPVREREIVMERPDGSRIVAVVHIDALRDSHGTIVGAINCFRDITRRQQGEQAAQWLAAIVESSEDAILAQDLDGTVMSWNRGAERHFGYTAEEIIGKPATMLIPADRHDEEEAISVRIRHGERVEHYETIRLRKDGSLVEVSLTVSPIKDSQGVIVGASKIGRDITERRRAQEQQRLLLREMDHRVKNLFTLSSSVVTLSARCARTPEDLAAAVRARLGALARAHALTLSKTFDGTSRAEHATTLHTLIRTIVSPYERRVSSDTARVAVRGPDFPVSGTSITSFALLLHEFATNAAKYGALSTAAGQVDIDCSENGNQFVLAWKERGGPSVARRTDGGGFGSLLANTTVRCQLGGTISRDWEPEGLTIRLSVDRDRLTS